MLTSDNPTHPEYLAMLQCLEDRRAEKTRKSSLELQLKLSVLRHRAVAERAQIMSQFYQAVRELRDNTMAELGEEWYQIQQERRRAANTIPDYGIRFPATRAQAIKNAVSYNKEVSVLSGFAKHVGFPAAPSINGVSDEQLEADFEAIQVSLDHTAFVHLQPVNTPARAHASQCRGRPRTICPPSARSTQAVFLRSYRGLALQESSSSNKLRGRTRTIRRTTSSASMGIARTAFKPPMPSHQQHRLGGTPTSPAVYSRRAHLLSLTAILRYRCRRHSPLWCPRSSRDPSWAPSR
jgi:hypothetical protein